MARRTRARDPRSAPARTVRAPRSRRGGGRDSPRRRAGGPGASGSRSPPAPASASRRTPPRGEAYEFSNLQSVRGSLFAPETRKWWTLAAVSVGLFMIMLDNTLVNVALPSIQKDLRISTSELEWVVNAYALTFGVLLLTGGKLADLFGRRLIFIAGLVVFTASSLWCGLATGPESLIAARTLQGVGAAMMNPATLSILIAAFPPRQRGTAIGIWAGTSALALAFGPLVGGLITEHLEWSWIFFVNVPIGILGIVASYLFIDESRDETHAGLDLPGLATSAVGLFALTYGLIEANTYGWTSARIVGAFVLAVVALGAFVVIERRRREPMLPLELL